MMTQRTSMLAVLLAALMAMGAGFARAQETVKIAVPNNVSVSTDADLSL